MVIQTNITSFEGAAEGMIMRCFDNHPTVPTKKSDTRMLTCCLLCSRLIRCGKISGRCGMKGKGSENDICKPCKSFVFG
jgi:hypothetical protein